MDRKPKKLSSAVLELKFMKKSKEKARIADADEQQQLLYADQLLALSTTSTDKVVLVGSHYDIMRYLPCRLSFGGMEPSIEKLNAERLTGLYEVPKEVEPKQEAEEEVDVSKEEMASHFSSIRKKCQNLKRKSEEFNNSYNNYGEDDVADHNKKNKRKKRALLDPPMKPEQRS